MSRFFSALNPLSSNSGITFRATKHAYSDAMLQQTMPDLTLDLVIPFLWHRRLSLLDCIYETFTVFYGDHFDKHSRGFGQKSVLDFTILPLLARKLIADTYLEERKNNYILNTLAWTIVLPIKIITFGVALAFTIALIPLLIGITIIRCLFGSSPPPPPPPPGGAAVAAAPMVLAPQTTYAALQVTLHRLELAGIRNPQNIRRLIVDPQNLALVYAMEHLMPDAEEEENQDIFDFLIEHRDFWIDLRVIENLHRLPLINQPGVGLNELQRQVAQPIERIAENINGGQSTHTASVHNSTAKSAIRLQEHYKNPGVFNLSITPTIAEQVKSYDKKLVGQRSTQEILTSLRSAIDKLNKSGHVEGRSGVSSRELLQYCWAAAHDPEQWREGVTQETAEACFYAALYEVDREYALSETGADLGSDGSYQACAGGAFNKMIEGMAKIHKLCEVNFITPATAALSLPCIVRQVVKAHLIENPHALEPLKKDGLSTLWPEIQSKVLDIMKSDFATLYPSAANQTNPSLLALVEAGEYTDLEQDLRLWEKELQVTARASVMMMC